MGAKKPFHVPMCPYCRMSAILKPDSAVYRRSYGGMVWLCVPCEAWVGCHRNSKRHAPLGRLAKAPLRVLKVRAHAEFDALWQAAMRLRGWTKTEARLRAYTWLAGEMGLQVVHTHIGFFDEAQTQRVIDLCTLFNLRERRRNTQDVDNSGGKAVDSVCMAGGP